MTHRECGRYAPVDAAKGLCRKDEGPRPADGESCPDFTRLPRCGGCGNYRPGPSEGLGACAASKSSFMAYADMAAKTCPEFSGKA
jgi:4-hydroxyphenylacetate decarboxylase small subunit